MVYSRRPRNSLKLFSEFQLLACDAGTVSSPASNFKMQLINIISLSLHFDLVDDLRDSELVSNSYAHTTCGGLTRVSTVCSCSSNGSATFLK